MILAMVSSQNWQLDKIASHLGVGRNDVVDLSDAIMSKAAKLYLPKGFIVSITVRAGPKVRLAGDNAVPNHLGAPLSSSE
jgi:hypothetical protein